MSFSVSALLTRNLHDVFGENDAARRRAAIDEIFTEDCVFYEASGRVYRGRDEIDRVAGTLRAMHPDFRYQPIAEPEELGNGGRVKRVEGRPGEAPSVGGTDFIVARDGRIAAISFFRQATLSWTIFLDVRPAFVGLFQNAPGQMRRCFLFQPKRRLVSLYLEENVNWAG